MRKKSPTTTTRSTIPSSTKPDCDHQDTRARCSTVSPSTRLSSMYDIGRLEEDLHQRLEAARVGLAEAALERAVEVEHADDLAVGDDRDHHLAAGRGIAGDVAGEFVHVGHDDRAPLAGGGAADALAERDAHARGLALERSQDELPVLHPVEAHPVEVGQGVEDQRGKLRRVGGEIALALEERSRLGEELAVGLL